ncbi:hypothetical protein ACWEPC_51340 [Nonomuraea sp. NPDC004297]
MQPLQPRIAPDSTRPPRPGTAIAAGGVLTGTAVLLLGELVYYVRATGFGAWELVSSFEITSWSVRLGQVVLLLALIPSTVRGREGARAVVLAILGITSWRMLFFWPGFGYSIITAPGSTLSQSNWIGVLGLITLTAAIVVAFSLLAARDSARWFWRRAGGGLPSTAARPGGVTVASWLLIGHALYQVAWMVANAMSRQGPRSIGSEISLNLSGIVVATASIVLFFMIRRAGDVARLMAMASVGVSASGAVSTLINTVALVSDLQSIISPWPLLRLVLSVIAGGAGVTVIVLLTQRDTANWFHSRRLG